MLFQWNQKRESSSDSRRLSLDNIISDIRFPETMEEEMREEMIAEMRRSYDEAYSALMQTLEKYINRNKNYKTAWNRSKKYLHPEGLFEKTSFSSAEQLAAIISDALIGQAGHLLKAIENYSEIESIISKKGRECVLHADFTYKIIEALNTAAALAPYTTLGILPYAASLLLDYISCKANGEYAPELRKMETESFLRDILNCLPISRPILAGSLENNGFGDKVRIDGREFINLINTARAYASEEVNAALIKTENTPAYQRLTQESHDIHSKIVAGKNISNYKAVLFFGAGDGIESIIVSNLLEFNRFKDDKIYYFFDASEENLARSWITAKKYGLRNIRFVKLDLSRISEYERLPELLSELHGIKKLAIAKHITENYLKEDRQKLIIGMTSLLENGDDLIMTTWGPQTPDALLLEAYKQDRETIKKYAELLGFKGEDFHYKIDVLNEGKNKYVAMYGIAKQPLSYVSSRGKISEINTGDKVLFFVSARDGTNFKPIGDNHAVLDLTIQAADSEFYLKTFPATDNKNNNNSQQETYKSRQKPFLKSLWEDMLSRLRQIQRYDSLDSFLSDQEDGFTRRVTIYLNEDGTFKEIWLNPAHNDKEVKSNHIRIDSAGNVSFYSGKEKLKKIANSPFKKGSNIDGFIDGRLYYNCAITIADTIQNMNQTGSQIKEFKIFNSPYYGEYAYFINFEDMNNSYYTHSYVVSKEGIAEHYFNTGKDSDKFEKCEGNYSAAHFAISRLINSNERLEAAASLANSPEELKRQIRFINPLYAKPHKEIIYASREPSLLYLKG